MSAAQLQDHDRWRVCPCGTVCTRLVLCVQALTTAAACTVLPASDAHSALQCFEAANSIQPQTRTFMQVCGCACVCGGGTAARHSKPVQAQLWCARLADSVHPASALLLLLLLVRMRNAPMPPADGCAACAARRLGGGAQHIPVSSAAQPRRPGAAHNAGPDVPQVRLAWPINLQAPYAPLAPHCAGPRASRITMLQAG
jgi:hypothetical protein